jgi:hypothetical protein
MRRTRKIGEISDDVIWIAALGVGGYFLFKALPGLFGGGGTDPVITAQMNMAPSQDPFSYQFQPFIDFYNNNTPTINSGGSSSTSVMNLFGLFSGGTGANNSNPTIQQFFQYLKQNPGVASQWGFLDTVDLSSRAENLVSAITVNPINPLSQSDAQGAMSALSGFTNQLQVAFIANYLWYNYQYDMLIYLQGSLLTPGLSSANLVQLINTVNSLPVNPS